MWASKCGEPPYGHWYTYSRPLLPTLTRLHLLHPLKRWPDASGHTCGSTDGCATIRADGTERLDRLGASFIATKGELAIPDFLSSRLFPYALAIIVAVIVNRSRLSPVDAYGDEYGLRGVALKRRPIAEPDGIVSARNTRSVKAFRNRLENAAGRGVEVIHEHVGGPNQAPQGSAGDFPVVRNGKRGDTAASDQDDVTSALSRHLPSKRLKYLDRFAAGHHAGLTHQAITSTLVVSTVSGSPNSARTSKHDAMASLAMAMASSRVVPWVTQPGMEGHSAIHAPSSSRSRVMVKFMIQSCHEFARCVKVFKRDRINLAKWQSLALQGLWGDFSLGTQDIRKGGNRRTARRPSLQLQTPAAGVEAGPPVGGNERFSGIPGGSGSVPTVFPF